MKPVVISYLRFSSAEQIKGDSKRRQLEMSAKWAKENGLTITETLDDLGISAFKGANAKEGKLADFLQLVEAGKIPKGSLLLVEELDRLSRQAIEESLTMFLSIIRAGITLITLNTGDRFEKGKLDTTKLMIAVIKFSTANDESAKKSFRLGKAWEEKRRLAISESKPLTRRLPSWLKLENGKIVIDKAKAAIVKRIFGLALDGNGLTRIMRIINAEKLVLARTEWSRSTVRMLLRNRAVIGEHQPRTEINGIRETAGEVLKNYFPPIITERDFYIVQNGLSGRKQATGRSRHFVNLFVGLLFAGDSSVVINDKGYGRRYIPYSALKGKSGFVSFPVDAAEKVLLIRFADASIFGTNDSKAREIQREIEAVNGEITENNSRIAKAKATLLSGQASATTSIMEVLTALDMQKSQLTNRLDDLTSQATGGNDGEQLTSTMELIKLALKGALTSEQRLMVRAGLRQLIERIECQFQRDGIVCTGMFTVSLKNGNTVKVICQTGKGKIYIGMGATDMNDTDYAAKVDRLRQLDGVKLHILPNGIKWDKLRLVCDAVQTP